MWDIQILHICVMNDANEDRTQKYETKWQKILNFEVHSVKSFAMGICKIY